MLQLQHNVEVPVRHAARPAPALIARAQPAGVGLAIVEAVIGYEWLLSALNKMLSPIFRSGLAQQMTMALQGNPNAWWVALARRVALPHAQLCAVLVEVGELLVALGFFAGAVVWASGRFPVARWARFLNGGAIAALLGGSLMTANYYLMAGETLPGLNPGNPFNEGLSIDGMLTLVAVGLLVVHVAPLWTRATRRGRSADRR